MYRNSFPQNLAKSKEKEGSKEKKKSSKQSAQYMVQDFEFFHPCSQISTVCTLIIQNKTKKHLNFGESIFQRCNIFFQGFWSQILQI